MTSGRSSGLGRRARLATRGEFQRLFATGRRVPGRSAILWFLREPERRRAARLGVSISAKAGGAVRRNRLKRLAREAFRLNRARLASGSDVLLYLRPGCRWEGYAEAERDILELLRRAGLTA